MKKVAIIILLSFYASVAMGAGMSSFPGQDLRKTASPEFVDLILSGANIMSATSINLKPSGDNDDYFTFSTVVGRPTITIQGGSGFDLLSSTGSAFISPGGVTNMLFGWDNTESTALLSTTGNILFQTTANNSGMNLLTHGTGTINFKPSGDTNDYFQLSTVANVPTLQPVGGSVIDFPGVDFTGIGGIDMSGILDLGANTIADGQMNGDWDFNGGDINNAGTVAATTELKSDTWQSETIIPNNAIYSGVLEGYAGFVVNDAVILADDPTFDGTNSFSVSLWLNLDVDAFSFFVSKADSTLNRGWLIAWLAGPNLFAAQLNGTSDNLSTLIAGGTGTAPPDVHLVMTWNDSTGTLTFYKDGGSATTDTTAGLGDITNVQPLAIGLRYPNLDGDLDGQISDVKFFEDELIASEVTTLFNIGVNPQTYTHADLILWWPLTDDFDDRVGSFDGSVVGDVTITTTSRPILTVSQNLLVAHDATVTDNLNVATMTISAGAITDSGGEIEFVDTDILIPGKIGFPPTLQELSASETILTDSTNHKIVGDGGPVTMTSTPTLATGSAGQFFILRGNDETNTVTLQDNDNLSGSELQLLNNTDFIMGMGDTLTLQFDIVEGQWFEQSRSDN